MHLDAEVFVALGFILFACLLIYLGVHKQLATAIDSRAHRIRAELDEATRLRREAEALLASFKQKAIEAEKEAAAIVAQARTDAELLAKESAERLAEFVTRRTKQAEDKIAIAETQATADVRAAAADAAVKAAEIVLKADTKGAAGVRFVDKGIADLKALVH
jgi:F-type H+-transporting ATPase subunit b